MMPYKFSQCFGDKSENIEVAEGNDESAFYVFIVINSSIL